VDYRGGPIVIEGTVQRVIAAPFNGFVKEAPVRPGDIVKKGAVICILDDRELKLEQVKLSTEQEQYGKQHQEAMAKHERAQARILKAKIDQAAAQISLVEEKLARSRIIAPFDSVVMSGDLSQSRGRRGAGTGVSGVPGRLPKIIEVMSGWGNQSRAVKDNLPSMPGRAPLRRKITCFHGREKTQLFSRRRPDGKPWRLRRDGGIARLSIAAS
jgi:hypothetical protein